MRPSYLAPTGDSTAGCTILDDLRTAYRLQKRNTEFFGEWEAGELNGHFVAFQTGGTTLKIYAGEFDPDQEQITNLYLGQVSPANPLPKKKSAQRLDPYLGEASQMLATRYFLYATGAEDYPILARHCFGHVPTEIAAQRVVHLHLERRAAA